MRGLGGHLGGSVSALVDGQLDPETAGRAWGHVVECRPCREAVERETCVKRRLSSLTGTEPSARLLGSLYGIEDSAPPPGGAWEGAEAWAAVDRIEERGRLRRRAGIALVGAGSLSAVVLGLVSFGGPVPGHGGSPTASLTRPAGVPTRALVAPVASVQGRITGLRASSGEQRNVALLSGR